MEEYEMYNSICSKIGKPIHEAIIDPFFYHRLGNENISNFEDLNGNVIDGLLNSSANQIEVWFKNKKVKKLKFKELNSEYLLFPLFNSELISISSDLENGIYVEQKEFGFLGSFVLNIEDEFNIENLFFKLIHYESKQILIQILYDSVIMPFKKKEPIIIFQNGFIVQSK
ncbi:hypothetical protein [Flavobacterium sp. RSSB_23]|uniref:hypothetical protein n=1 Tax=Flavobacterium sp. RSSB_23 TaxID=3447668 RepID=UPI003F36F8C3